MSRHHRRHETNTETETDANTAIAKAFETGTLDRLDGQFIPCDYVTLWLTVPMIIIAHILPLVGVLAIILSLFNGSSTSQTYIHNFLNSDLPTQAFCLLLIGVLLTFSAWQFFGVRHELYLDALGLRESWRERNTGQRRYGLVLTSDHFALRCFAVGYDQPFIVRRDRIIDFYLGSEYSASSHERTKYIVMAVMDSSGQEYRYRLPNTALDQATRNLYPTLRNWLQTQDS